MSKERCDIIILGTGPAGLQAAIHASRKKADVIVLGKQHKSGAYGAHIENYCCISGINGETLLREGRAQAEGFGAVFVDEDVMEISQREEGFYTKVESGRFFYSRALILAMGISRNKLHVPGEKEFLGRGVSYCVECDANFFKGEPVAVIGSESAALSGALTLLFYAKETHLVSEKLQVVQVLLEQLKESAIILHEGRKVTEIRGATEVESILLDDGSVLMVKGVFIELGAKGALELTSSLGIALDSETMQYIATNKKQETNIPGLYAAGDICGPPWQIAKAVGEGCVAGLEAAAFVKRGPAG